MGPFKQILTRYDWKTREQDHQDITLTESLPTGEKIGGWKRLRLDTLILSKLTKKMDRNVKMNSRRLHDS